MAWRLARSLERLRTELDQAVPSRKKPDGILGDAAHASRASRHNPNNAGVVCAVDISNDPAHGLDIHALAREIVRNPQRDLEYVISNDQVASKSGGWRWKAYKPGVPTRNRHVAHAHFAVGQGPDAEPTPPYDDTDTWGVAALLHPQEDDMAGEGPEILERIRQMQTTQERQNAKLAELQQQVQALRDRLGGSDPGV